MNIESANESRSLESDYWISRCASLNDENVSKKKEKKKERKTSHADATKLDECANCKRENRLAKIISYTCALTRLGY